MTSCVFLYIFKFNHYLYHDSIYSLFVRSRHVPRAIFHLLPFRQELVQVLHAFRVFVKQLAFTRDGLPSFYEVQNDDGRAVALE